MTCCAQLVMLYGNQGYNEVSEIIAAASGLGYYQGPPPIPCVECSTHKQHGFGNCPIVMVYYIHIPSSYRNINSLDWMLSLVIEVVDCTHWFENIFLQNFRSRMRSEKRSRRKSRNSRGRETSRWWRWRQRLKSLHQFTIFNPVIGNTVSLLSQSSCPPHTDTQ